MQSCPVHPVSGEALPRGGRALSPAGSRLRPSFGRRLLVGLTMMLFFVMPPAEASPPDMRTDANLVTAIDVSDSIGRHEEWLQQTGLVRALVHPDFLRAATSGRHGRIGFAVFTWSSGGAFEQLVPWTVIGSAEDAARLSASIASVTLIDRTHYGGGDTEQDRGDADNASMPDRRTDLSAAIDFASLLLRTAPNAAVRSVMNICANGVDNVEGGVAAARERALAQGTTINGLVLGRGTRIGRYFQSEVIGGSGAFVMELADPDDAAETMVRKFVRDLMFSMADVAPRPAGGIKSGPSRSSR